MRPADVNDELPGRPTTPRASAVNMLGLGTVVFVLILVAPALAWAMWHHPTDTNAHIGPAFVSWALSLDATGQAVANAVSAFAVLLLTLFIEESLKASDTVPVSTRRSIARFAFFGGVATAAAAGVSLAGATSGGNVGVAVQTVASACVVLFFASHIATRSVVSLSKQRSFLLSTKRAAGAAIKEITTQHRTSRRATIWMLTSLAVACVVLIPVAGFFTAAVVDTDNTGGWVGGLLAIAYLGVLLVFLSWGTTSGSVPALQICSHIFWWLFAAAQCIGVLAAFTLNSSGNPALPLLFLPTAIVSLLSAPLPKMPVWSPAAAVRGIQHRSLLKSQAANETAIRKLDEWEARFPPLAPAHAAASQDDTVDSTSS